MRDVKQNSRFTFLMAMDELCKREAYENVSIDELCEMAGLSKSTFYRIFTSKLDLALWYQSLVLKSSLGQIGRTLTWVEGFTQAYEGFLVAPAVNQAAKYVQGVDSTTENLLRQTIRLLSSTITEVKKAELTDAIKFQIDYFAHATRTLSHPDTWTVVHGERTPQQMAELLSRCVPRDLFALLDTPSFPDQKQQFSLSGLLQA